MQSVRFRRVLKDVRHVDREDYAMPVEETTVTRLAKSATYTVTCVYRATNILGVRTERVTYTLGLHIDSSSGGNGSLFGKTITMMSE